MGTVNEGRSLDSRIKKSPRSAPIDKELLIYTERVMPVGSEMRGEELEGEVKSRRRKRNKPLKLKGLEFRPSLTVVIISRLLNISKRL